MISKIRELRKLLSIWLENTTNKKRGRKTPFLYASANRWKYDNDSSSSASAAGAVVAAKLSRNADFGSSTTVLDSSVSTSSSTIAFTLFFLPPRTNAKRF